MSPFPPGLLERNVEYEDDTFFEDGPWVRVIEDPSQEPPVTRRA